MTAKKTVRPLRPYKPGQKIKPGRLAPGATARDIGPAAIMSRGRLADAFNRWQMMAMADPGQFEAAFETAAKFARQLSQGKTPTYGDECAAFLMQLFQEQG